MVKEKGVGMKAGPNEERVIERIKELRTIVHEWKYNSFKKNAILGKPLKKQNLLLRYEN